ncbi:MAG: PspA/IM30 family protein [Spartobacteria bacterium]|nr:PspA/IM30 family protein [Spartobacteria bacterium]
MGLIQRLKRITSARIESFLSSVEDPEVLFPQLVREMEDQVRAATEAEAKAKAAVKHAQRDVDQLREKIEYYGIGAKKAIDGGDEGMAREAISAQLNVEEALERKQAVLERADDVYEDARSARERIQRQLEELRAKKDEILTRARVAKNQLEIQRTVSGPVTSSGSILDAIERLESRIEEQEAELEIQQAASGDVDASLDERLDAMADTTAVDERLAALKRKIAEDKQ